MTVRCHRCARELAVALVGVRDVCTGCGAWLHCCRNCEFYERGRANDCREPRAERVVEKEAGNFCDWFRPAAVASAAAGNDRARATLDDLFRKKKP
jgi:hypothetical protein